MCIRHWEAYCDHELFNHGVKKEKTGVWKNTYGHIPAQGTRSSSQPTTGTDAFPGFFKICAFTEAGKHQSVVHDRLSFPPSAAEDFTWWAAAITISPPAAAPAASSQQQSGAQWLNHGPLEK